MSKENTYIILRDLEASKERSPYSTKIKVSDKSGIAIEADTSTEKEIAKISRQKGFIGAAPLVPLRLIKPLNNNVANPETEEVSWGVTAVQADQSKFTGKGVKVAVLDTGIDIHHTAFKGVNFTQKDFTGEGVGDVNGHGTHCAGTIFGKDVGGKRIGIARGVEDVLDGKILDNDGDGDLRSLYKGLLWAVGEDADVISLSLGFDFPGYVKRRIEEDKLPADLAASDAIVAAIDNSKLFESFMRQIKDAALLSGGCVIVAAAGNESCADEENPNHRIAAAMPSATADIISVGAIDKHFAVPGFSNKLPDVCAPGVNILSAKNGNGKDPSSGLTHMDGTSMACPHVAGVAALWWEKIRARKNRYYENPYKTVVKEMFGNTRDDVFDESVLELIGRGNVIAP